MLLRDGALIRRAGDPAPAPAGTLLRAFRGLPGVSPADEVVGTWIYRLTDPNVAFTGLYEGSHLLLDYLDPANAAGFGAGTTYASFRSVFLPPGDPAKILVRVSVQDPNWPAEFEDALL